MAVATRLLGSVTWNTTAGSKTVVATPAVGDQIFLVTAHSGFTTTTTAPTDNNPDGLGAYTVVGSALKNTSADLLQIWRRNSPIGNASSTTFSHAPATTTGGGLGVIAATGTLTGSSAVAKFAVAANQAASTTPSVAMGSAVATGNAVLGAVFSTTNGASVTQRTGYTEQFDAGYNTPTSGLEIMTLDSGETASTIAWGSTVPSAYSAIVVEIAARAVLVVASAVSGSQADNVALTPHNVLAVDVGVSAGQADAVTLAPKTTITVAGGNSASQVDNFVLSPKTLLILSSANSLGQADNVVLANYVAPPATWSAAASYAADYTLSNGNLTATKTGFSGLNGTQAQANTAASSGYWEVTGTNTGGGCAVGLSAPGGANNTWIGFAANSIGYHPGGNIYLNNSLVATYTAFPSASDTIMVCLKGGKVYFGVNGTWQSGTNPSTNTGGIDVSAYFTSGVPTISANDIGDGAAAGFTASALLYPIPTGVTAWDGTTVTSTTLAPDAAVSASLADSVVDVGHNVLTVGPASSASLADAPVLAPKTTLGTASAVSASLADAPVLAPKTTLGTASAVSTSLADSVVDVAHNVLTVGPAGSASQADAPVLAPKTTLVSANAISLSQAGNVTLAVAGSLSVNPGLSLSQADNTVLTNLKYVLAPASAVSVTFTTGPTLASAYALSILAAVSASLATSLTLSVNGQLGAQSAVSTTLADNVVILPKWAVSPASAISLSQADNVLEALRYLLTVAGANSAGQTDNVTLTNVRYTLAPSGAISLSQAGNVTLVNLSYQLLTNSGVSLATTTSPTLISGYALTAQGAVSLSQVDAIVVVAKTSLVLASATSLGTTTSPTLLPKTSLLTNPAVSSSQADNVATSGNGTIGAASAISVGQVDNVVLLPKTSLLTAGAVSASLTGSPTLGSKYVLTAQPAVSVGQLDAVVLASNYGLALQSAVSASQAGSIVLASHYTLPVLNAVSLSQTNGVALLPKTSLIANGAVSLGILTSPLLSFALIRYGPFTIRVRDRRGVEAIVGPFEITG